MTELCKRICRFMTKYGNIDTRMINCQSKIVCSFEIGVVEEMIPKFTLEVYHVRHIDAVDYGTVEISTRNIGENYVSILGLRLRLGSLIFLDFR